MLGPESVQMGNRTAKSIGGSPVTLYLTTENADRTVAKAVKLGATVKAPVGDMFWGDRCGTIVDPDGISWMIATHMADPTPQEMMTKMKAMFAQNQSQAGSAASS